MNWIIVFTAIVIVLCMSTTNGTRVPDAKQEEPYTHGYSIRENNETIYPSDEHQTPENLVGMIYAPRAGPLHTNREFPVKRSNVNRQFISIYDNPPSIRKYN